MTFPPAIGSLRSAVRLAIHNGNTLSNINLTRWSETYACQSEDVRREWDRALSEISMRPSNQYEEGGK